MMSQKMIDDISSELKESVEHLNAKDLSDLNQVRNQALDSLNGSNNKSLLSWWLLPAGAMAMLCVAVIIFSVVQVDPSNSDTNELMLVDNNHVSTDTELAFLTEEYETYEAMELGEELYEELEFYEWLDAYDA